MSIETDMAFAMGMVVVNGSFTGDNFRPLFDFKAHTRDWQRLEALQLIIGGRIHGPYSHGGRTYGVLHVTGPDLYHAAQMFEAHLPASFKRDQFLKWRELWSPYFERQRLLIEKRKRRAAYEPI